MVEMKVIAARKTTVVELGLTEALEFVQENHRSGKARPGLRSQCFGLSTGDEIIAVAIFCNPRTASKQRQYTTELLRLAFKNGWRVQGGASKLIKHFQKLPNSTDLFTYQDTSGESTSVYEHSGLTLVGKKNPKKTILVRDGLTAETAENNHHDWFSMEQATRRGPDALIGTELGEVIENGKRVSNIELFLRNGYHKEVRPGDRLYEWHNPKFRFYTYKITSSVDDSYYYGRHRTQLGTLDAMLHDGYMGSGGVKFKNWIESVGEENLQKTILKVYNTWAEAIKAEEELIGDKHKTDKRCKNSKPGGTGLSSYFPEYTLEICPIHGLTKFRGGCKKCSVSKAKSTKNCPVHGETLHIGDSCYKCVSQDSWTEKECPTHGVTLHKGNSCARCATEGTRTLKECSTHGLVLHSGDKCITCIAQKSVSIKTCEVHGETKHVGDRCKKCMGAKTITQGTCEIHGETKFKGDKCCKCSASKIWDTRTCKIHGETPHRSGKCEKCNKQEQSARLKSEEVLKKCSTHGLTAHLDGQCKRCKAQKQINIQTCPIHGETKFNGPTCGKCAVKQIWTVEECSVHGETKHRSGKCERCARKEQWDARKVREKSETD